jgi:hypothetical protein
MTLILAIDPGDVVSGVLLFDEVAGRPVPGKILPAASNTRVLSICARHPVHETLLLIETFHPRGQPLYKQLVDTAFWSGRFVERWEQRGGKWNMLVREAVKHAICGRTNVGDPNVRAALVDRFGGKDQAIGKKKTPGPLHGVSKHAWPALALAVAWADGTRPSRSSLEP